MAYFPMYIELDAKTILVIGGGRTALGKVQRLQNYGASFHVIAAEILPELEALPRVTAEHRCFQSEDLEEDIVFVIAATDSRETNHEISLLCREKRISVNVVDTPADCSFLFPALVRRGPLSIGISTGGASPGGARYVKEAIDNALPQEYGEIFTWLNKTRPLIKERLPAQSLRADFFETLFGRCLILGRPLTEAELETLLRESEYREV